MDKKNKYWQLFLSTFKLSACTFGGGFVIIPLMRERFVKELQWIEEEEMLDLTAIAQSSPGSIAINASILVGYHVAGIPGALITVVGSALPPLIIISIISAFYQAFRSNKYVSMAMTGMLAGRRGGLQPEIVIRLKCNEKGEPEQHGNCQQRQLFENVFHGPETSFRNFCRT